MLSGGVEADKTVISSAELSATSPPHPQSDISSIDARISIAVSRFMIFLLFWWLLMVVIVHVVFY